MPSLFDLPFDDAEPRQEERPRAPQPPPIFTVSELTADIRAALEMGFSDVHVEGEISNCRAWNTGHLYFTLKDAGAQIRAVMFRSAARLLKFKVQDGQHVVARGRLSVYDTKGEYQIICESLEPRGLGALQLAFDQLKRRLAGGDCSSSRGSVRCRSCRARLASSPRSRARPSATCSRCSADAIRRRTS